MGRHAINSDNKVIRISVQEIVGLSVQRATRGKMGSGDVVSIAHLSKRWVVIMNERRKISKRKWLRKRNVIHLIMPSGVRGRIEASDVEMNIPNIQLMGFYSS